MSESFPTLFSPLKLRAKTLKNRIVFGAHTANMSHEGLPGDRHFGYYRERARGGAAMIVVENLLVLSFGNVSITLQRDFVASLWPHAIAAAVVVLLLWVWRATIAGKLARALLDSPLNLALRGVPVARVEIGLAMAGFALLAVAGLLWASDGRVKPSMCLEIGLIGAVAFIVGKMFSARLVAVMLAAIGLAGARVALSYFVEGDWSMTAVALLLLAALTLRRDDRSAIALRS